MAIPFKECNFQRSDAGILGSNTIQGSRYVCLSSQFVLLCVATGLVTGRFHSRGVLPHFRKQIWKFIIWDVVSRL